MGDGRPSLACVVLAHTDPVHVRRLVEALDPFPVFLHCDAATPDPVVAAMTADLPARCTVVPRRRTGWARWENVAAELDGYRLALAATEATHVALLTGSDYPVASAAEIEALLAASPGVSFARCEPLPYANWGRSGGWSRLRYRHWAFGRRMVRLPVPRRLPAGLVYAGGSQLKVLSRQHAQAVVTAADLRPDLVRFFRRSWVPDETFVPTVLSTPTLVPNWAGQHVAGWLWWIDWDAGPSTKSPPWLGVAARDRLLDRTGDGEHPPVLFARKFRSSDSEVLDLVDDARRLRTVAR